MKWHRIIWTGLVILGACSLSRTRQVESVHNAHIDSHDILVNQFAQRDTHLERTWYSGVFDGELTVFSPKGVVHYHPDSGLKGAMTEVRFYSGRVEVSDSTYHNKRNEVSHTASHESVGHYDAFEYSVSETVQPQSLFPQWGYVVLAFVIGIWLFKKFR